MAKILIRKGNMKLVDMDRSDLIDVNPSHDGIVFNFKNNAYLYFTDQYLPVTSKELMKVTSNNFPTADLEFDLANYAKPVIAKID
jgi:hypothetical protein